ncbi:hypothetical protein AB0P17_42765 [Streptomyces sp. NPDC088124]
MVLPLPRGFPRFQRQFATNPLASPGRVVEPGESFQHAVVRELAE